MREINRAFHKLQWLDKEVGIIREQLHRREKDLREQKEIMEKLVKQHPGEEPEGYGQYKSETCSRFELMDL